MKESLCSKSKLVDIKALTGVTAIEVRWEWQEGDDDAGGRIQKQFPHIGSTAMRTVCDRNKSEKTISRSVIDQRIIEFAFGSVETYGSARSNRDHPMLDQYFFSFPEMRWTSHRFRQIPMKGTTLYIPLGSMHGVDVKE